ncbi:MAG: CGNR zinc finger domain-containing protein [Streptomycetales bacterium]
MLADVPPHTALLRDVANTLDAEDGTDGWSSPGALAGWLRAHGLLPATARVTARVTAGDLRRAVALRDGLRAAMTAHHDGSGDSPIPELDTLAERLPLRLRFDLTSPRLAAMGGGVEAALAGILVAVQAAAADGTWRRLKLCPDQSCRVAFVDTSKNRSRSWCSMQVCGNRHKTRTYRSRRGSTHPTSSGDG